MGSSPPNLAKQLQATGLLEASILAEQLHWQVQFLPSIPDDRLGGLVNEFVADAHSLLSKISVEKREIASLLDKWFKKGQGYEGNTVRVPEEIGEILEKLADSEIETFVAAILTDMDALCRLIWAWFQRGRAFERGNALMVNENSVV